MSTRKSRRASNKQIAAIAAIALLATLSTSVDAGASQPTAQAASAKERVLARSASADDPIAHAASAKDPIAHSAGAVARESRRSLRRARRRRAADAAALRRAKRALRRCERKHPRRCRSRRRAVRRARARLKRDERSIRRLRARAASARLKSPQRPENPAGGADSGSNFGEPFVKGIDTNLQGWGPEAVPQIASEMNTLGVDWAREDLEWSKVEPRPGVFDWSGFDAILAAAKANGITILPIVGYAPSWTGPTDATAYAAFVKAAVQRYGPGTSADLRWWELWNEPYFAYAWSGHTPEPEAYARDVVAAAQAARSVAPSVKLLVAADYEDSPQTGGSSPWQTTWIDDMFAAEPTLGRWIDGVSVHPYGDDPALPLAKSDGWLDANGEWAFRRIDNVRAKFLAHGVDVPFWITEAGWSTDGVSEAQQATDYADLIPQVAARPWVRALFPYCLREFNASGEKEAQFGLLRYGSWQPKPAFHALQIGFAGLS